MRLLQKMGAGIMVVGFLLVLAGGVQIHRGPDGTCVHVTVVHAAGFGVLFCGLVLSFIAAFAGKPRP